ncbi:hypothetical protein HOY82DRAFT_554961 [Tuber indicum]|nr:hypothetical protein HOY82DRAFT_554961 [Tuber indicum]
MTKLSGYSPIHSLLSKYPHLNAASINYRLSVHPDYPSNSNEHFSIEREKSVLVGRSTGVRMAFLVDASSGAVAVVVVEVEGIYNSGKLVEEYADCEGFVEGAPDGGWKGADGNFWWR